MKIILVVSFFFGIVLGSVAWFLREKNFLFSNILVGYLIGYFNGVIIILVRSGYFS
jgi:hypothetical protein